MMNLFDIPWCERETNWYRYVTEEHIRYIDYRANRGEMPHWPSYELKTTLINGLHKNKKPASESHEE